MLSDDNTENKPRNKKGKKRCVGESQMQKPCSAPGGVVAYLWLRALSRKLLPYPGAELADESVFIHLAAEGQEAHEIGGSQARKYSAGRIDGVLAVAAEQITDQGFPFAS